jgi:hypothetical protein
MFRKSVLVWNTTTWSIHNKQKTNKHHG